MSSIEVALRILVAADEEVHHAMGRAMALKTMIENMILGAGEASRKLEQAKTLAYSAIGPRAGNISGMMVQLDDKASAFIQGAQAQLQQLQEYLTMANMLRRELGGVIAQLRGLMGR